MKKVMCLLLILGLTLLCLTVGGTQAADLDTLRALDVNADGTINILDLTLVTSYFGKAIAADQMPNPDVTGDGIVNILDLVLVAGHIGKTVPPPVAFVSVSPVAESQLEVNDTITLTFDNTPENVIVSTGTPTVTDQTVAITGPFETGSLALTVTWKDGSQTLTYTVRQPATFVRSRPVVGANLDKDDRVMLIFDNPPEDVTVSTGTATTTENTVTITGPFNSGELTLTVTWKDGSQTLTYTIRPPVTFIRARPTGGATLDVDATITLTFDRRPEDLTVSSGVAKVTGRFVDITGPFDPGDLSLTITWKDGTETVNYNIRTPDTDAPRITSGSVSDGDADVDPDILNSSTRIEIEFNEAVTGNISLQTAGVDVGWLGKVDGKKGILELVRGKELGNGVTYIISGKVSDAAGNETDLNITFTTESKTTGIPFEVTDATFNTLVLGSEVPVLLEYVKDG